jgi:GT2 family glycosyltransferase
MEIGGMDEDFYGRLAGADDDLSFRLVKYGCDLKYAANIIAVHQHHPLPEGTTTKGFATSPDAPSNWWEIKNKTYGIVRNIPNPWGQYPRDMSTLPAFTKP